MEGGLQSFAASGSADAQPLFWLAGGPVLLPEGHWYSQADFHQAGPDLLIETAEGDVYVVPGYFQEANPPLLETAQGTVLNPQLVQALADSPVSGQVAQIGVDGPGMIGADLGPGEPIGQISELEGTVTVTRADGAQETLSAGDDIYQGDVLETGSGSTVGVVFVDDTIFTLDEGGRMVMDEMVYDPGSQTGVFNAQVVQGVFSLVSGKIAKTAPDAMTLSTPELTIGIRGTTAAGEVPPGLFFPGGPGGPPPGGPPPGGPPPETKIMMMTDVGGTVGELFVLPTNNPNAQPIVLNAPGAGIVSVGGGIVPRTFTQQEIQQTAGKAVTKLVKVVAVKAQQDAARATRQAEERSNEAQQAEQDAQQTEQQAQQTEQEAQQDQEAADALEAEAEAEAAQAEAELQEAQAIGDEQAAAEAAAKAAEAAAKAQVAAEIKAAAEAKVAEAAALKAEAAAKAAEAAALQAEAQAAQQQAQQAQQFQQQATTAFTQQAQAFEQFTGQVVTDQLPPPDAVPPGGPVPPNGAPPPDAQAPTAGTAGTVQDGPTPEEQAAMDAATKQAYEEALAAGATPEEAFNAAAMLASGGNMDDPAVDIARAAFEDALAQGLSPEEAMLAAQSAVEQYDIQMSGTFDPNQPPPDGFDPNLPPPPDGFFDPNQPPPDATFDPNQPPPDIMVYDPMMMDPMFYDPMMMDPMFYDPMMMDPYAMDPAMIDGFFYDPYMDPYAMFYDPYMDPNMIYDPFAYDQYLGIYDYYYDPFFDPNLTSQFGETVEATAAGGTLSGTSLNTNFHFYWPTVLQGTAVVNYTITDAGGINQLSFDGMNSVAAKVFFSTSTSGTITVYDGSAANTGTHQATINFSSINQFLLSDIQVSGFTIDTFTDTAGGDVLVLSTMAAGESGYAVAGTNAAETITINTTNYPDLKDGIFFAKGGGDTINMSLASGNLTVIGGITSTDNNDTNSDFIPDSNLNSFSYVGTGYAAGSNGILANLNGGDTYVTDRSTQTAFSHDLWDVAVFTGSLGDDLINVNFGYYNAIYGNTGADTITVQQSVRFYTLDAGDGNDTVKITTSQLSNATSITGGVGTDSLTIDDYTGGTIDLTTATITAFESIAYNGNFSASNAVTLTGANVTSTIQGTAFADTITGGTANDTIIGGEGADTLSGGGGNNIFQYNSTTAGGDNIQDFVLANDQVKFNTNAFNSINGAGALNASDFIVGAGTTQSDGTAHYIYDSTNSILYYDADATAGGEVAIADFSNNGVTLTSANIVMA